jgi:hypothetical protein
VLLVGGKDKTSSSAYVAPIAAGTGQGLGVVGRW